MAAWIRSRTSASGSLRLAAKVVCKASCMAVCSPRNVLPIYLVKGSDQNVAIRLVMIADGDLNLFLLSTCSLLPISPAKVCCPARLPMLSQQIPPVRASVRGFGRSEMKRTVWSLLLFVAVGVVTLAAHAIAQDTSQTPQP